MKRNFLLVLILVLSFAVQGPLFAQEENLEYSWGIVKNVSSNQIIVTEYDFDKEDKIDVEYLFDKDVELEGVRSVMDIKSGAEVDVTYLAKDGKKLAKSLTVFELYEMEE
jgi:hypothetical protein